MLAEGPGFKNLGIASYRISGSEWLLVRVDNADTDEPKKDIRLFYIANFGSFIGSHIVLIVAWGQMHSLQWLILLGWTGYILDIP